MLRILKNRTKGIQGFTLIELLVVIAIIGILSSVVLASLSTAREKSRDAKRITDVGQIQLALELYFDAQQSYPRTNQVVGSATADGGVQVLQNSGFLATTPVPPAGPLGKYQYRGFINAGAVVAASECEATTETCVSYFLSAVLEREDNTVLDSDTDTDASALGAYDFEGAADAIGGAMTGLGLNAATDRGCGWTVAGDVGVNGSTELCYDQRP